MTISSILKTIEIEQLHSKKKITLHSWLRAMVHVIFYPCREGSAAQRALRKKRQFISKRSSILEKMVQMSNRAAVCRKSCPIGVFLNSAGIHHCTQWMRRHTADLQPTLDF